MPILIEGGDGAGLPHRVETVSYTHLDVYKRQVLQRIRENTARSIVYKRPKFKVGDRVRISKHKMTFAKGSYRRSVERWFL